jgi:hypothetical protein
MLHKFGRLPHTATARPMYGIVPQISRCTGCRQTETFVVFDQVPVAEKDLPTIATTLSVALSRIP